MQHATEFRVLNIRTFIPYFSIFILFLFDNSNGLIGFLFRNIDNMSWNSNFMKKLIGINIGLFAWAYYINSLPFGENLTPATKRNNPLEVN